MMEPLNNKSADDANRIQLNAAKTDPFIHCTVYNVHRSWQRPTMHTLCLDVWIEVTKLNQLNELYINCR